jgi:gpW
MTCEPSGRKMTAQEYNQIPACEKLAILEHALNELLTGQQKTQIRYGDNWVQFGLASAGQMKEQISYLRALCNSGRPIPMTRSGGHNSWDKFR